MTPPRELLDRLPGVASRCRWHLLRQVGLSGAMVWRGEIDNTSVFALKRDVALPPAALHRQIDEWWRHASQLPFIPKLHAVLEHDYATWTVADWMPGTPVLSFAPNDPRLDAACDAIFQTHDVLKLFAAPNGPIPAIRRRIDTLQSWAAVAGTGLRGSAGEIVQRHRRDVLNALLPWLDRAMPRQPCLVDLRADHMLFTGDTVTGIIDFNAMKIDSVAADAARYLGETCPGRGEAFQHGCDRFARHHGAEACPPELVDLLDRSGMLGAIAFWLGEPPCPEAERRLARLVERWHRLAMFE